MRKGLRCRQVHTGHQVEEERETERETEEDKKWQQQRRAEKKLLAYWMSLYQRTRTFFRTREHTGFQRSPSAARLLKSEA